MTTTVITTLSIICLLLLYSQLRLARHRSWRHQDIATTVSQRQEATLRYLLERDRQMADFLKNEVNAQLLSLSFGVKSPAKQPLREIAQSIHRYAEVRVPFVLEREGLLEAVTALTEQVELSSEIKIDLVSSQPDTRYHFHQEWAVYHLIEALLQRSITADSTQHIELHLGFFNQYLVIRYQQSAKATLDADDPSVEPWLDLLRVTVSVDEQIGWFARIPVQSSDHRLSQSRRFGY